MQFICFRTKPQTHNSHIHYFKIKKMQTSLSKNGLSLMRNINRLKKSKNWNKTTTIKTEEQKKNLKAGA